ncbi:hypothetical protein SESBI_35257 [Sesbania bispinosa]|nr:hypothetical protein SESBI_35257 [Sesbania bispinosa]
MEGVNGGYLSERRRRKSGWDLTLAREWWIWFGEGGIERVIKKDGRMKATSIDEFKSRCK